jgi:GT2 family glycosyltransferase
MGERLIVTAIVVTWNSAGDLERCLQGIAAQTVRCELIVVDNASSDESVAIAAPYATKLIRNATNLGFAAAVNQGIAASSGKFVQLLNPDCFLAPDYCEKLMRAFDAERVGMATGKLLLADTPTLIDSKGIRMTRSGRHFDIDQGAPDVAPASAVDFVEVFGVSGAAAMYSRAFLEDVAIDGEIFDEDFFAYREDADLSWRGRIFGWRAMYVPAAVAHHVRRVTPERRRSLPPSINMHSVKNRFLLRLKNEGAYLALRNLPFELSRDLVTIAAVLTIERTSLPALGWLWRNRKRTASKRRAVQSRRRVSDRALAGWFR